MKIESDDGPVYLTPAEFARQRGIPLYKVFAYIECGALAAEDHRSRGSRLPRWKITAEAIAVFDRQAPSPIGDTTAGEQGGEA